MTEPEQWAVELAETVEASSWALDEEFDVTTAALTIQAAFAEQNARLVKDMQAIMDYFETNDGNAPGHGHSVPGVWDKDVSNGPMGGLICHWCKQWNDMRATLAALKDRTHG